MESSPRRRGHALPRIAFPYLRWLPLVVFLLILLGLGAAPILRMLSPSAASAPFQQAETAIGDWRMVASAAAGDAGRVTVLINFISTDDDNLRAPPVPEVTAIMVGHPMSISAPALPDGPTGFRADLISTMAGDWIVTVGADGARLRLPLTVQ